MKFPIEIASCLDVKFEEPPNELLTLFELIRTYKIVHLDEAVY